MSSKLEVFMIGCAAVLVGTAYVVVHEHRRKQKKVLRELAHAPISKEMLLKILNKSAEASKAVIEKIRMEVRQIQQQRNLSDEHALQLFQQNFEHSLDQLIAAIRSQYKVTEKAMDSSFKIHQSDPEVQQAIQNMRMLSRGEAVASSGSSGRGSSSPTRGSSGGAVADAGPIGENGLPQSLTKDRLKEIMTFNAVMLEKELRPIKEHVERAKRSGAPSQLDPQVLMQVQMRISQAVQQRFGVNDEQVMAAVEVYGAKEDPGFKPILRRIASTLSTSLS